MKKYSKGDYVEFMTRQPQVHVEMMFGYGQVPLDEIKEERHVGRIKSVIGNGEAYLIVSLEPLEGFYCVENSDRIIRLMDESEVTEEMRSFQGSPEYTAPNVYMNETPVDGSVAENCEDIARRAMASLFPEEQIVKLDFKRSSFLKEDIIGYLDNLMTSYDKDNDKSSDNLEKMKAEVTKNIMQKRFREYYQVDVGVKITQDEDPEFTAWLEERGFHSEPGEYGTKFYLVAIDSGFKEVSIMRDIHERSCFYRSLGPEFDDVTNMEAMFRNDVYEQEQEEEE